jgi:uncharacterized GH25 family protein
MKRKLVGGIAVLIVAVTAWFVVTRSHRSHQGTPTPSRVLPHSVRPATPAEAEWRRDVDPEGSLRLEGQVVDDSGDGVGGATVTLSSEPPRQATTEPDGSFAFDKLVGREYSVSASEGERVSGSVMVRLTATSDPVIVRLHRGAKVIVDVKDDAGAPVVGATVKLLGLDDTTKPTAADGTATLSPVQPGWFGIEVTADGYAPASSFGQVGSGGATATVHVHVHKGVAVSGRVVDEAGTGLAKVHITILEPGWIPATGAETTTNDKGEFTFPVLPAGTHRLRAEDDEHAPAQSEPITIADRAVTGITITMNQGGVLRGQVVDTKGAGVPYATVRVAHKDGNELQPGRKATADKQGSFEVRGLARRKLQVRASSEDASSKLIDLDLSAQPLAKDLRLVLDETSTIAGVVVDGNGKPVPEIQVTARIDVFASDKVSLAGTSSATTDGAGAFTMRGLPDGTYRLTAVRGGESSMGWEPSGVTAKTGDKGVKITLAAPAVLVGKIALESGAPPTLANIQLGYHPATPAAPDGTFRIDDLEPGKYDVRVLGPEFAQLTRRDVELEPGKTTDLGTLVGVRGRKLTGRVVDPSGTPVAGARVTVSVRLLSMEGADDQLATINEMTGARMATTDQNGDFAIIGIAKTHAFAGAEHPDKGRATPLDVAEGSDDPPPITLQLRGFGTITGKVTSKGEPAGNVMITDTLKGSLAQVAIARTADDGTFTLSKVAEGTHVLNAMQMQMMSMSGSTSATVDVVAGQTVTVAIDIPVGNVTVDVTIKPVSGAKVNSALVYLFRGTVAATTGKQLNEQFGSGGMQSMKVWQGDGSPMPEFEQIVPGSYSVCGIPITGNLMDPAVQQRLQEHDDTLRVYCKPTQVMASPTKQAVELDLPAMMPLPTPTP